MELLTPILRRVRRRHARSLLFSFSGGAGGWPGMGAGLFEAEPAFRASIEATSPLVRRHLDYDVLSAFTTRRAPVDKREDLAIIGQIEIALRDLWRESGVEPDAVLGVSLGEAAAAYTAGALTREDAVAVQCAIADGATANLEPGTLFAVAGSYEDAAWLCRQAPVRLDLVGGLSVSRTLLLAAVEDADAAAGHIEQHIRILRRFHSVRASHTSRPPGAGPMMRGRLSEISPRRPDRPCFLASAGRDVRSDGRFDHQHWTWLLDHPFRLDLAVRAALEAGFELMLNCSPGGHNEAHFRDTAERLGRPLHLVQPMSPDAPEPETAAAALAAVRSRLRRPRRPVVQASAVRAETLDLNDPEFARDPWGPLAEVRRHGPVQYLPRNDVWAVLEAEQIRDVLSRPAEFSNRLYRDDFSLLGADPPEHTHARREVGPILGPGAVDPLATVARGFADEALAACAREPELDFANDVAVPVVHRTIARLMEIPESELEHARARGVVGADEQPLLASERVFGELRETPAVAERWAIDPADRPGVAKLLWFAGTITTVRVLTWAVYELGRAPGLRAAIADDPDAMDRFITEVMRVRPPELFVRRQATADVPVDGVAIPEGALVVAAIGLANRDPVLFPEPERIDLRRPVPNHFSLGHGVHRCPGGRLSRTVASATLQALLARMPEFAVRQPECALRFTNDRFAYGPNELWIAPVA